MTLASAGSPVFLEFGSPIPGSAVRSLRYSTGPEASFPTYGCATPGNVPEPVDVDQSIENVVRPRSAMSVAFLLPVDHVLCVPLVETQVMGQPDPPQPGARSVTSASIPPAETLLEGFPVTPKSMTARPPRSQSPSRRKYGLERSSPHVTLTAEKSRICAFAGAPGASDQPWMNVSPSVPPEPA